MRPDMQPVGDMLVSYSAAELPLDYIEGVHREVMEDFGTGERNAHGTLQIVDLLLKITLQKLRATA